MTIGARSTSLQHLLSQQLHGLSQLGETITLRLLELEERINNIERQEKLLQNGFTEAEVEELLSDSETRVKYLQSLLESDSESCVTSNTNENFAEETNPEIIDDQSQLSIAAVDDTSNAEGGLEQVQNEQVMFEENDFEQSPHIDDSEMTLLSA